MELPTSEIFPLMVKIERDFPDLSIKDIPAVVREEMVSSGMADKIRPGDKIAVTAGSRGIDGIAEVLRLIGEVVRSRDGEPFVVPAMGSHGGATAQGQKNMLEELGMSENAVGMPIRSSMETVEIGTASDGVPVHTDKIAFESDGIIAVNRIKPHTSLLGKYGSGLCKMLAVGLGKESGATSFHRFGPFELERLLPEMARMVIEKAPVLGGLGLVEDSRDKPAIIKAALPGNIPELDADLLGEALRMMPTLPFDEIDVLVVEQFGKDISGTGMDANVIGRRGIRLVPDLPSPRIKRIAVLGLSEHSQGNAHGIGMADIVTERFVEKIDWKITRANGMASSFPEKDMLPLSFPSDRETISAALATSWTPDTRRARMVIIKNSLALDKMLVSESMIEEVKNNTGIEIKSEPTALKFDDKGRLKVD